MKTADNGCFLRYQAEPESLTPDYRYSESADDKAHKSIAAISEVMYADMLSLIIPDRVPEYRLYRNIPAEGDVQQPEFLVATKMIADFEGLPSNLRKTDGRLGDKEIRGFGEAYIASSFIGDCDVVNINNVGVVEENGVLQTKRIDFGFGGWFAGVPDAKYDDIGSYLSDFIIQEFEVGNDFVNNGIVHHPFDNAITPEGEERQVLQKIVEIPQEAFEDVWQGYKPLLLGKIEELSDEKTKARMLDLVEKDMPLEVLLERQASLQAQLGGGDPEVSYTNSVSGEESLAMDRKLQLRRSSREDTPQEGITPNNPF